MAEAIQTDLSKLRVFTNRGTIAYPLSADGVDPANESPDSTTQNAPKADDEYAYKEDVSDELREQLGAILFRIDSAEGSVWSYFRAQLDKPVQLTGECVADTVGEALDSLPILIEEYVTAVRGGTLDDRSPEELEPDADAQAFATLSTDDTTDVPWSDRIVREMVSMGPLDIDVPSVASGVQLAREFALKNTISDLDVVVTKGSRTDAVADVDIVISIADVEEPTLAEPSRLRAAQKQMLRKTVARGLGLLRPTVEDYNTSRQRSELIAETIKECSGPIELSVRPKRQAQLQLVVGGLLGVAVGLLVATSLAVPSVMPSGGTIVESATRVAVNLAVIVMGSLGLQVGLGIGGASAVGFLLGRQIAPAYLPERLSKPLLTTPTWWPTRREQLLITTVCGLTGVILLLIVTLKMT